MLAFAASFFARGFLAGEGRFGLLAGLLVSESFSRMAFALLVALGITAGQDAVARGIVAAPSSRLIVVPLAFSHRAARTLRAEPGPPTPAGGRGRGAGVLARSGAFAGAVLLIMLTEQIFLNGGPLLIRAFEGAAAAGYIFNVLMLARAPLLVFQGVAISLLPHLTRLRSRGDAEADADVLGLGRADPAGDRRLHGWSSRRSSRRRPGADADRVLRSLHLRPPRAALVTAAMGLYLAATTLNQAALARGLSRQAATCWIGCAAGFLVWCLLPVLEPARRIELGFLGAAAALFALLLRLHRSAGASPTSGAASSAATVGLVLSDYELILVAGLLLAVGLLAAKAADRVRVPGLLLFLGLGMLLGSEGIGGIDFGGDPRTTSSRRRSGRSA